MTEAESVEAAEPQPAKGLDDQLIDEARGHFPNEQAALKCVYMAIMSLDPTGKGRARWTMCWKTALNALDITFDGRLSAARQ